MLASWPWNYRVIDHRLNERPSPASTMVVYSLTNAPKRTRGLLSRYCMEIGAGLFVGRLNKRTRLKLWLAVMGDATAASSAVMAWSQPSEQGYAFESFGSTTRRPVLYDGLWLVAERGSHLNKDAEIDAP